MHFNTLKIALAAATLSLAPAAYAADNQENRVEVAYADLDLTSEEGIAELDRRIDEAAREVCGVDNIRVGTRLPSRSARKCYEQAKLQLDTHFAQIKRDAYLGG